MADFVPFLIVMLCNYNYIANPYLAAKLIEVGLKIYRFSVVCFHDAFIAWLANEAMFY